MTAEPGKTKASEEELKSLKAHFKEVEFREYPLLAEDCKRHLIGCLDGRALIRLGRCSKNEQRLTAEFPLKISKIRISHLESRIEGGFEKFDVVNCFFDDGDYCQMYFEQVGTGVVVTTPDRRLWEQENSEYFKEAVKLFETLLHKCHYGVEKIILKMGPEALKWAARDGSPVESLPNVRIAEFGRMDSNHLKFWLKKMPDHLETLEVNDAVPSDIVELPQFRNARNLHCGYSCGVTDAELLELKVTTLYVHYAPNITERGLNAYLKRWKRGEGVDGFQALNIDFIGRDYSFVLRIEDILEGLDARNQGDRFHVIRNNVRPIELLRVGTQNCVDVYATEDK